MTLYAITRGAVGGPAGTARSTGTAGCPARRSRLLRWGRGGLLALALLAGGLTPSAARAEEEDEAPDGRLEGYANKVEQKSSNVLTWFLFFTLVLIGLSSLFKTAKRE